MRSFKARALSRLVIGVSATALGTAPGVAWAQDAAATVGQPGPSETAPQPTADTETADGDIVVTGIRASLRQSIDIKRNAQGVVDAISAEDIGKFPDTNLAESLQRITGVSIDRSNGEGQFVTVRGFGPEYNLVVLNGRQMPTSALGNGDSAPSSRSFDFANLASEGVAALEVYKSGRATVPSGGIGSTINIRTPRPFDKAGIRGSLAVKGVDDLSRNGKDVITPEVSGIFSDTFADDRVGVLVTGSYQRRKFSVNQANVGFRDGYLGNENNWGSLAMPTKTITNPDMTTSVVPDTRYGNIQNRPDATDVYQVPQNAGYDVADLDRERINGQAVLQFRPIEALVATVDYTYSRNKVTNRDASVGIWYNHNDTSSSWTDGPVAGPNFYTERFTADETKDLSYSGALTSGISENKSLGGNLTLQAGGGMTVSLDAHHSTAESRPGNKYGTNVSVGTAIFGVRTQTIDFTRDLPRISFQLYPGLDPLNAALIVPTGNAFRNAYQRDEINQVQLKSHYDHDGGFLDSLDFGVEYTDNKVRSAFGLIQNDTWGGAGGGTPAQRAAAAAVLPDNLFSLVTIPDKFKGLSGANDPNIVQSFYKFDFEQVVQRLDSTYKICGGDNDCSSPFTTDRRIRERTISPFFQANLTADVFSRAAHLIAGVRYESTEVSANGTVPTVTGARQNSGNEFNLITGPSVASIFKGKYQNWLPAVDFDVAPLENVKLRASYSHTITRANYASLAGGQSLNQLFRIGGGDGSIGNPGLIPYKSKNIDLSAEWYYGNESYISVGYFHKNVANYISTTQVNTTIPGVTAPITVFNGVTRTGPRYAAALAALAARGQTATYENIFAYFQQNFPAFVSGTQIIAGPDDPAPNFVLSTPFNSDRTATIDGFEFAIQHNFWNTGFGTILNYTIVNSNRKFDNRLPSTVDQFAINGLSDSANAVLFYDKNGIQARVAYNWRDEFLNTDGRNPFYTNAYGQVDASASVDLFHGFTVFAEGINITGEDRGGHLRSDQNIFFATRQDARYSAGVRFAF